MIDKRIRALFDDAVAWGREIAKQEGVLREVQCRLRMAAANLQTTKDELLLLLPVKSVNTKARLTFALASSATADAILELLSG